MPLWFWLYRPERLPAEKWRGYLEDVGRPLFAAVAVAMIGRIVVQPEWNTLPIVAGIGLTSVASLLAATYAANRLEAVAKTKYLLTTFKKFCLEK